MTDVPNPEIHSLLQEAISQAESLQARIHAGESIDEKELEVLARVLATQMEEVRNRLEQVVGPVDPEELRLQMQKSLSDEEYTQWLQGEAERTRFRQEFAAESPLRNQFEVGA